MNSPSISPFSAPYHFNSVGLLHIYYIIQGVLLYRFLSTNYFFKAKRCIHFHEYIFYTYYNLTY